MVFSFLVSQQVEKSNTHAMRFVSISAAEFHCDIPTTELILLSDSFVSHRHKLEVKKEVGEEDISEATKENRRLLSNWNADFILSFNFEEPQPKSRQKRRGQATEEELQCFLHCGLLQ